MVPENLNWKVKECYYLNCAVWLPLCVFRLMSILFCIYDVHNFYSIADSIMTLIVEVGKQTLHEEKNQFPRVVLYSWTLLIFWLTAFLGFTCRWWSYRVYRYHVLKLLPSFSLDFYRAIDFESWRIDWLSVASIVGSIWCSTWQDTLVFICNLINIYEN